jgi:hypothetical protein
MRSGRWARRLPAAAGVAAIIAMGAFTAACGTESKQVPSTTTTTTTTTTTPPPPVSPTEKTINPTGGNRFTPTVIAPPAPTAVPGDH